MSVEETIGGVEVSRFHAGIGDGTDLKTRLVIETQESGLPHIHPSITRGTYFLLTETGDDHPLLGGVTQTDTITATVGLSSSTLTETAEPATRAIALAETATFRQVARVLHYDTLVVHGGAVVPYNPSTKALTQHIISAGVELDLDECTWEDDGSITLPDDIADGLTIAVLYASPNTFAIEEDHIVVANGEDDALDLDVTYQIAGTSAEATLTSVNAHPLVSGLETGFLYIASASQTPAAVTFVASALLPGDTEPTAQTIGVDANDVTTGARVVAQVTDSLGNPCAGLTLEWLWFKTGDTIDDAVAFTEDDAVSMQTTTDFAGKASIVVSQEFLYTQSITGAADTLTVLVRGDAALTDPEVTCTLTVTEIPALPTVTLAITAVRTSSIASQYRIQVFCYTTTLGVHAPLEGATIALYRVTGTGDAVEITENGVGLTTDATGYASYEVTTQTPLFVYAMRAGTPNAYSACIRVG